MKGWIAGFVLGFGMGIAVAGFAGIPQITGANGYLNGWTVLVKHKVACTRPFLRVSEREIECLK